MNSSLKSGLLASNHRHLSNAESNVNGILVYKKVLFGRKKTKCENRERENEYTSMI